MEYIALDEKKSGRNGTDEKILGRKINRRKKCFKGKRACFNNI